MDLDLSVSIFGSAYSEELKYTLYTVTVKNTQKTWVVKKRYREFDGLRQTLNTAGVDMTGVPFPEKSKSFFGLTETQLEDRTEMLDSFLKAALIKVMPKTEMMVLREFLGANARSLYIRDLVGGSMSRKDYDKLVAQEVHLTDIYQMYPTIVSLPMLVFIYNVCCRTLLWRSRHFR